MENIIEVKNLRRIYRLNKTTFEALKGISFNVKKGEVFGLLGPNGAGKTTTIKILSTLLAPTSGISKVMGYDTFGEEKKIRKHINFIFGGERSLYYRLTAYENLEYFSDLYKIPKKYQQKKILELLELVGLTSVKDKRVETFSKGMKQRLQISRALLNSPSIIFLDEPSIGLDPVGAKQLREIIKKMSELGVTIILTTHYLAEAQELCDRIAIINKGEIVAMDNILGLQKLLSAEKINKIKKNKEEKLYMEQQQEIVITLEDIYLELIGDFK